MRLIELLIDGQSCDIDQRITLAISHEIANISEPDRTTGGYSKTVTVPITPRNRQIMRFTEQILSVEQFNNAVHTGELRCDGITVIRGVVQMSSYQINKHGGGTYFLVIQGATIEWLKSAQEKMNTLTGGNTVKYALPEVYANSVDSDPNKLIRFLPVDRGAFWVTTPSGDTIERTYLDLADYHPFINIWQLLRLIYRGYTVRTSLQEQFTKLYMSGYMPEAENTDLIEEDNGFLIGIDEGDVGKVLQIHGPQSDQSLNTAFFVDLYKNLNDSEKGYFVKNGVVKRQPLYPGSPETGSFYVPTEDVNVKFRLNLNFATTVKWIEHLTSTNPTTNEEYFKDFKLMMADQITFALSKDASGAIGNDKVELKIAIGPDQSVEFADRTEIIPSETDSAYALFIRIDKDKDLYKDLRYNWLYGNHINITLENFSQNGDWVVYHASQVGPETLKLTRRDGTEVGLADAPNVTYYFIPLTPVEVNGVKEYTLTYNLMNITFPYELTPSDRVPLSVGFDSSSRRRLPSEVEGRSGHISVLLGENTTLEPDFSGGLGYNEDIGIDVVGGTIQQIEVIQALRNMFNLMFYTNPLTKEVIIEPRPRFYVNERGDHYAGAEIKFQMDAFIGGKPHDVTKYDFTVRLGTGNKALTGNTNLQKGGDFKVEISGTRVLVTVPAHVSHKLTPGALQVGVAATDKATGVVEIDETVTTIKLAAAVDWSEKIDLSKDIAIEELGADIGTSMTLAYQEGGEVHKRVNRRRRSEYGSYTVDLENKIPTKPYEFRNNLWAPCVLRRVPSVGFDGGIPQNAPDNEKVDIGDAEMNITSTIVQYVGTAERTSGSDTMEYPRYPLVKFQDSPTGVNIGFSDITSSSGVISGLHQYFDYNIDHYNYSRRIVAYIALSPKDVEPIIFPNRQKRDFRALFILRIRGEKILCRLESITDYNPAKGGPTKCTFVMA